MLVVYPIDSTSGHPIGGDLQDFWRINNPVVNIFWQQKDGGWHRIQLCVCSKLPNMKYTPEV